MRFKVGLFTTIVAMLTVIAVVHADEKKSDSSVIVQAGKEGFVIKSPDQNFSLKIGGYIHADSRFLLSDDSNAGVDTFQLTRARLTVDATFYKHMAFRFMPDFGAGTATIQDAYFEWTTFPQAKVRVGKFKAPVGLERLYSATALLFVARAFPTSLVPNRDIGLQVSGDTNDSLLHYSVAFLNGTADGSSVDVDTNDGKDGAARIFINPNAKSTFLGGFGFGISGTYGEQSRALSGYRTPSQINFFAYNSDALADGRSYRISPQFQVLNGPVIIIGEYVLSSQDITRIQTSGEIRNSAWQIAGGVNLTGEKTVLRNFEPEHSFDPGEGHWGTLQFTLRYSELDFDEDAFILGFADPTKSAKSARQFTSGVNWYWNRNVKVVFNYERTKFNGGTGSGDRETENAILTRLQVAF